MGRRLIGADEPMADALDRVVGTIRFAVDHTVPGMLHGRLVTSQSPHARIVSVDASEALAVPGVHAVVTGADIAADPRVPNPLFGVSRQDQPPLATGTVRYTGEPVALVLADTERAARQAAVLVDVEYEDLPFVTDPVEALRPGAPVLHEQWPDNACGDWRLHRGDVDAALREAEHVVEHVYHSPAASQVPLEPFAVVAQWDDEGGLELWSSTQWPSAVQRALAHMFDRPLEQVRVHAPPLGGGYGAKGQVKIEPMVACAALLAGRPVRLELDRVEVFHVVCKHEATMRLRTAVDAEGRLLARDIDLVYNAGAYGITDPGAAGNALVRANGPYRVPAVRIRSRAAYTSTVPSGSYRGAMTNQVSFAYESQLDEIATLLGKDPYELRRLNLLVDGDTYATGETMHDVHFVELLDEVASAIDWHAASEQPAAATTVRGKGLAVILKSTPTPSRTECRVELHADGSVVVFTSSVEMGQGAFATIAQLAAHHLEVDLSRVTVVGPDTARTPFDTMTAGSRTTFSNDHALHEAAVALRERLDALARQVLGWSGPTRHADGAVGTGEEAAVPYELLLAKAGLDVVEVTGVFQSAGGEGMKDPSDVRGHTSVHWHQGAVAVEVEVDLETGKVEVLRCHGASWAGRVVNPTRVRQQNDGCMIMGIGTALYEDLQVVDGQVVNPNLSDYMIPSILDVPRALTSRALVSDDPAAELHGVGEMTIPATAPAIANAVFRATGARVRDLPLTAERVLSALRGRGPEEGA